MIGTPQMWVSLSCISIYWFSLFQFSYIFSITTFVLGLFWNFLTLWIISKRIVASRSKMLHSHGDVTIFGLRAAKFWQLLGTYKNVWPLSIDQYRWRATKFWQLLDTFDFWAGRNLLICYDTRPRFLLSNPNDRHHFMSPWATSKRYRGIQTYVALSDKQKVLWNPNHRRHFMSPWATSKRYWGIRATGTILCRLEWQAKGTEKS